MAKTIALPQMPTPPRKPGGRLWLMRGLRIALIAAIVALLMFQADRQSRWRADDPVRLDEAQELFADAARVARSDELPGGFDVTDTEGQLLGQLVRTMPAAEGVVGYRGPTDTLLALDTDGTVIGMRLRRSADTPDHLRDVADDREFMANFTGWRLHDLAEYDNARELEDADIWPVSGATLTSSAVIDGVVTRAKAQEQLAATPPAVRFGGQDAAITLWILGGLGLMFTKLRKSRRFRAGFRVLAVVWHLGFGGGLIAVSLLTGWAMHGPAWRSAPALAALVALMFALPLLLGKNAYCQELCPHGILQGWLRRTPFIKPAALPKPARHGLRWLAPGLLLAALLVVLLDLPRGLAGLEPFDTYPLWRSGGWAWGGTAVVFILGLAVSVRYPMAYCQHACPTGWLLRAFSRSRGPRLFSGTDLVLLALAVIVGGVVLLDHRAWHWAHPMENVPTLLTPDVSTHGLLPPRPEASQERIENPALLVLHGKTMRTTWRVVALQDAGQPTRAHELASMVTTALARMETDGSVWHSDSDPARLNKSAPGDWVALRPGTQAMFSVARDVQLQSRGAFNPTLGHQVAIIGLGPPELALVESPAASSPSLFGWEISSDNAMARRLHGHISFDFGGILQGCAADQVAKQLLDAGVPGCLVEVGGEACAVGAAPPGGWRVLRTDARGDSATLVLTSGESIATSDSRATTRDGNSHLIDPATHQPQQIHCRATILASDTATADAWATALAAAGPVRAQELAVANKLKVHYEWIDSQGYHQFALRMRGFD